jgi:hypothetical protein
MFAMWGAFLQSSLSAGKATERAEEDRDDSSTGETTVMSYATAMPSSLTGT